MKQNKPQGKPLNKALQLSGAGLQMGVTIYLGFLLGEWLDQKLEFTFLTEVITLFAIFLAMYSLIKQANKINE
jgi:membrane protein DedA with SNARE-associated domain|tara:strand:- start:244 stop:462 length:219 start_codon:yes stop_codon:yes gene_type:complete